jgi:hypothetical protein
MSFQDNRGEAGTLHGILSDVSQARPVAIESIVELL